MPANVLLAADGTPKVPDFGLAKRLDEAGQTASAAVLGMCSYMAPEQAGRKPKGAGPGADVCALGAILYGCLTGRPPFKGAASLDTIMQVLADEPPWPLAEIARHLGRPTAKAVSGLLERGLKKLRTVPRAGT
jgi:serine/threonine protein kinase